MSYNIGLRTRSIAGEVNIFDSTQVRWVTGGVTLDVSQVREIDSKKRLGIGEFLGKIASSGKYGPVKRSAVKTQAASGQKVIQLDADVLGGAAYFQVGDVVIVDPGETNEEEGTIASIDYDDNKITLEDNLSSTHDPGVVVKAKGGLGEAVLMLGETVDFRLDGGNAGAYGDQVATAFDWARVLSARLPRTPDDTIEEELKGITFS